MLPVLLIGLALLIFAPAAAATYPGRNGDLLVTERIRTHGTSDASRLLRIDPRSGSVARIDLCAQSPTSAFPGPGCYSAGPPAASPDGRWVAFAAQDVIPGPPYAGPAPWSVRVLPLATGERRQVPLAGRTLTYEGIVRWTPGLGFVLEADRRRILAAAPEGHDRGTLAAPATAPDVASDGRLAFVRRGLMYAKRPGARARRLARGAQPSWSPHGRRIAFGRGDAIHTVRARGGRPRRLTRGFNPVWSPDGKRIAFFRAVADPAYFNQEVTYLFVLDLRTRRVRRVTTEVMAAPGEIPPNGLDWQAAR
jgi:hypothetical protein